MATCDASCAANNSDEVRAGADRVEYKANVEDVKEDVKEEVPAVIKLFGDEILTKDGKIATKDLCEKDVLGVYFSAHWCPPCRRFTPRLAEAYNNLKKKGKSIEIVFVSSDSTQADFERYYKEMPWVALPYSLRELKSKLSSKFDVKGIPRLLLIDPKTGNVTNPEANQDVVSDQTGEKFPYFNPYGGTLLGSFIDAKVNLKDGNEVSVSDLGEKHIILFFHDKSEASKSFLETLTSWYDKFHSKLQNTVRSFEVITWVGIDETKEFYDDCVKNMPWTALSYKEEEARKDLFRIAKPPQVLVINAVTGNLVTDEGTVEIEEENGDETSFPWPRPKPCNDFNEKPSAINNYPCFVLWLEDKSKEEQMDHVKQLTTLAKENVEWNGDREFGFFYVLKRANFSGRLRDMLKQKESNYTFTLVDFKSEAKYNSSRPFSVENLKSVMAKFKEKSLELEKLE